MLESSETNQPKRFGSYLLRKFRPRQESSISSEVEKNDEKDHESDILSIYLGAQKKEIAQVILNGYNIEQDGALGSLGAMRSFKIVRGDLWDLWNEQTAAILANNNGQETIVKVAALPVDYDSFGLIEFISNSFPTNDKLL
jgi:hypothetical protein